MVSERESDFRLAILHHYWWPPTGVPVVDQLSPEKFVSGAEAALGHQDRRRAVNWSGEAARELTAFIF